MVDNGIKPVYVFDGKPPEMKSGELGKRAEKREEATKQLALATDAGIFTLTILINFKICMKSLLPGDTEQIDKFNRRLVKVTKTHNDECKQLLKLMGIPYVEVRLGIFVY